MNARIFLFMILSCGVVYGLVNFLKHNEVFDLFSLFFVCLSVIGLLILLAVAREDSK